MLPLKEPLLTPLRNIYVNLLIQVQYTHRVFIDTNDISLVAP